jgi:transposase-like protein
MSVLSASYFQDEASAYAELERTLWPHGPVCPRCGGLDRITTVKGGRLGLYRCGPCKRQFTVKVGTVFESSHVPLHQWLQAVYLMCNSKKGISSHQLMRVLDVQYKTAWFMTHRIREAMKTGNLPPMGGNSAIVEADETYFGNKEVVTHRTKHGKPGLASKRAIVTLVQRGGEARSFHVDRADKVTINAIVHKHVAPDARLMTGESRLYSDANRLVASHERVNHSGEEYVRGDVHTNTVEGFYSVFKRGMKGVYQHCSEKHLHRYVAEFDFRYNNRMRLGVDDTQRTQIALRGIVGKRLTYRT